MGKVAGIRLAFALLAAALLAAGCGGRASTLGAIGTTGPAEGQIAAGSGPGGWLEFPPQINGNYSAYRLTSDSERTVEGTDYSEAHGDGNYSIPATEDYVIVSGSDDPLAWATYHLADFETERPVSLQLAIAEAGESPGADPLPLSCWLGVTDYTTNHWQWYGPFVQPTTLVLNSALRRDRYVGSGYVMSFALLTLSSSRFASGGNPAGRTAALIDCSVIATLPAADDDYLATKPQFAPIADVSFGAGGKGASELQSWQHVNFSWDHIVDTANSDCEADEYYVYRRGPDDETRLLIGSVNAPAELYTDPEDNDLGVDDPVPGVTYTYYLRAGNAVGYTAYDAVPVTIPDEGPTPDELIITAYAIRIDNAANGIGFDPEVFDQDHTAGTIEANSGTSLGLEWIAGTFNGLPFSGEDEGSWPEDMTQADYDTAFAAVRDNLEWSLNHGGAADFRRTRNWLVLDSESSFPVTADPGGAVVFPDDDPESTGDDAEGTLSLELPDDNSVSYPDDEDLTVSVPSDVFLNLTMDIGFDPAAPLLQGYLDSDGEPLTNLSMSEDTLLQIPFEWGVNGEPADLSQTGLELHEMESGTSAFIAVDFVYSAADPAPGQFTYLNDGGDDYVVCLVPFSQLKLNSLYCCRLNDSSRWSSINRPENMLETAFGPETPLMVTFPEHCWPEIDELQVFQQDPVVRRNPALYYDFDSEEMKPVDEVAYNDVLKINGDEFFVHVGADLYPKAAVVETDDPSTITSIGDGIPGILSYPDGSGRVVINITVLTYVGNPGDPLRVYCYKLFDGDNTAVGWGTFDVYPVGSLLVEPQGLGWGVNVFDREELELNYRTYDNVVVNGDRVGTATPDVLWFEIDGGWLFDADQDEKGTYATYPGGAENLMVRVQDSDSGEYLYAEGAMRVAGMGATGSYLIIHTVTNLDWRWPGVPGWPGILSPGRHYDLSLDDPHYPGLEYTFASQLVTTGTNPNT